MDGLGLCRLCANQKNNLLCIYGDVGSSQCIDAKIKKCLNIELAAKESLPKSICLECCTKLDAFAEFLDSSQNAQETLNLIYSDKDERAQSPVSVLISNEMKDTIIDGGEPADCSDDLFPVSEPISIPSQTDEKNQETVFVIENDSKKYTDELKSESSDSSELDAKTEWEEPMIWFCSDCSEEFGDVESLKLHHANEHKQEPRFMCIHCSKMFFAHNCFINHVKTHRNNIDWELMSWLCSDCSEEFTDVEGLKIHHANEHKQEPKYMCNHCSKLFLVLNAFISHIKRHKNNTKYSCDDCGKGFSNKKVLESHKLSHSDVRPYVCQECSKSFRQQSALYIHMRCHLPEDVKNKYPCDLCNKRFSTKPNLVTHKRIHTGVRNFTCDQCGKSFIQKGNLDAHLLTHSHDKPFCCEVCSKRFKTSMQLRKHHSVHTGAKPHQCDVCGRTFREKGTLREHHRIHTGAMPFTCEFCGKSFRFKGILTTHRRQHTGERPYSCVECQHHFTNWPNYNKHMKRRHGINTSRSTRTADKPPTPTEEEPQELQPETQTIYTDIQQTEIYTTISGQPLNGHNLPTYMAYNVYSLSHVPSIDGTTINILPRNSGDMNNSPGAMVNVLV